MRASRWSILLLCLSTVSTYPTTDVVAYRVTEMPKKCCDVGYAFDEDLECVRVESSELNYTAYDVWRRESIRHRPRLIVTLIASSSCRNADRGRRRFARVYPFKFYVPSEYCVERTVNGTTVMARCEDAVDSNGTTATTSGVAATDATATANGSTEEGGERHAPCQGLRTVVFWGAQTYMDTNVAHVVLCLVIVVVYLFVPELGKSVYNRAVLRHNVCLLFLGCILTFLGYCDLCECSMSDNVAVSVWIALQYFTNATGFWLNVICFDMTFSITRFRWTVGSGQRVKQEEDRRLLLYGALVWGGAMIPAIVALVLEYYPGIPEDFPLKPNYRRYRNGPNVVVNLYFFGISLLLFFWNNVLFAFTTYKIVRIWKSTEMATQNQTNALKKRYLLFLQLYLLMGSPWFFGSLFACLNKLVILKICRLIQPVLCILMLAGHKKLRHRLASKLRCVPRRKADATSS